MISQFIKYAEHMNANNEVIDWINSVLKNYTSKRAWSMTTVEHIIDYLVSDSAPKRLLKMSFTEALSNAEKWTKSNQKKGRHLIETNDDVRVFKEWDNGFRVVELLTENSFKREGYLMNHCLGGYNPEEGSKIYSLRDASNMPHATLEVSEDDDQVFQIKGKANGTISPKYVRYIIEILNDFNVQVRSNEMKNLGYYHIPAEIYNLCYGLQADNERICMIGGAYYVYQV